MNVIDLWWLSLAIFAVVVVVVAALLGVIITAAKRSTRRLEQGLGRLDERLGARR